MAKLGEKPKIRFERDGKRYVVWLGDDRAGFVHLRGATWHAADTFMEKSREFVTRRAAGEWLRREAERALADGTL